VKGQWSPLNGDRERSSGQTAPPGGGLCSLRPDLIRPGTHRFPFGCSPRHWFEKGMNVLRTHVLLNLQKCRGLRGIRGLAGLAHIRPRPASRLYPRSDGRRQGSDGRRMRENREWYCGESESSVGVLTLKGDGAHNLTINRSTCSVRLDKGGIVSNQGSD
jgi:hypothetical protein